MIVPALALLIALPWLHVLWEFAAYRTPRPSKAMPSGWKYLVMDLFSDRAYRQRFDRRVLLQVELVLLAVGAWRAHRRRSAGVMLCVLTALVSLVITYAFAYLPTLKQTEPYRYLASFCLFAIIPATLGIEELLLLFQRSDRSGRLVALGVVLALAPSLTGYAFDVAFRNRAGTLDQERKAIVEWVRTHARRDGRILCDDEQLGDMLPYHTGQEVVGGALTRSSPLAHKASWLRGRELLSAAATASSPRETESYLKTYNIAYVITSRRDASQKLLNIPGCSERFRQGRIAVYATDPALLSFVFDGGARPGTRVSARMNRISVESAPAGRFVLKYHYVSGLREEAGVRLYPVPLPADPIPFIGVDNADGRDRIEIGI